MIISEYNYAMLLLEQFFKMFTNKEIVDATKSTEVLVALSVENKNKVNEMLDNAWLQEQRSQESHKTMVLCMEEALKILMGIFGRYFGWTQTQ